MRDVGTGTDRDSSEADPPLKVEARVRIPLGLRHGAATGYSAAMRHSLSNTARNASPAFGSRPIASLIA